MIGVTDFEDLEYSKLIDLLGDLTKEYTTKLVSDPKYKIEDDEIYLLSLLIKEINLRENQLSTKEIP